MPDNACAATYQCYLSGRCHGGVSTNMCSGDRPDNTDFRLCYITNTYEGPVHTEFRQPPPTIFRMPGYPDYPLLHYTYGLQGNSLVTIESAPSWDSTNWVYETEYTLDTDGYGWAGLWSSTTNTTRFYRTTVSPP